MNDVMNAPGWKKLGLLGLWVLLPLILGVLLALLLIPQPIIGKIYLNDSIYANTAKDMIAQIDYARSHPEVRAVVLILDSPGGTVADTESVYMELEALRQTKPIVTVVESMAASGAYYLAVGTDYIISKPTSEVGNVGVIGTLPSSPEVYEDTASTGPYKLWGGPRDAFLRQIEMIKGGFYQAVKLGRGDALKMPPEDILRGEIWPGSEALHLGVIDALGSQLDGFEKAGQLAHISHYRVADLRELAGLPETINASFYFEAPDGTLSPYPRKAGLFYLYIPPAEEGQP